MQRHVLVLRNTVGVQCQLASVSFGIQSSVIYLLKVVASWVINVIGHIANLKQVRARVLVQQALPERVAKVPVSTRLQFLRLIPELHLCRKMRAALTLKVNQKGRSQSQRLKVKLMLSLQRPWLLWGHLHLLCNPPHLCFTSEALLVFTPPVLIIHMIRHRNGILSLSAAERA